MRLADEEEMERAAVHARRHPQDDLPGRRVQPPDASERRPHAVSSGRRSHSVAVTGEPQQQRVAAELQQAAVLAVGDRQEAGEDRTEDVGDLLGPHLPVAGQALGHLREAGDVDEQHRAVEGSEREMGLLREPADQQPRSVRPQDLRALVQCLCHGRSLLRPAPFGRRASVRRRLPCRRAEARAQPARPGRHRAGSTPRLRLTSGDGLGRSFVVALLRALRHGTRNRKRRS